MKKLLKDFSNNLIEVRVDCENDPLQLSLLLNTINDYVDNRGWKIEKSSCGHHSIATNKHVHYHLVVSTLTAVKIYSSEIYQFNKYLKQNKIQFPKKHISLIQPHVDIIPSEDSAEIIPNDESIEMSIDRWLRYPLKEGVVIEQYCKNIDIENLKQTAVAHFQFIKEQIEQNEIKHEETKLRWNKISKHIEEKLINPEPNTLETLERVHEILTDYTRNENPPVTFKFLQEKTCQYLSQKSLLTKKQELILSFRGPSALLSLMENSTPQPPKKLTKDEQETLDIIRNLSAEDRNTVLEHHINSEKLKYYYNL